MLHDENIAEHGGAEGLREEGLLATQAYATLAMLAVASGALDEPAFTAWLHTHAGTAKRRSEHDQVASPTPPRPVE